MLSSMNYYVLPFTSYDERNRMIGIANSKQQSSISPLLLILSKALNQSLSQYSVTYYNKQLINSSNNQQEIANIQVQQKSPILQVVQEENHINKVTSLIKQNQQCNKTAIDDKLKQKGQNSTYSITNDEIISEISSEVLNHNKFKTIRKQNKDKFRSTKNNFEVTLPRVTLLQTAELPSLSFEMQELRQKKQSLMRRQVGSWSWKSKARNQKRQIRMLNR